MKQTEDRPPLPRQIPQFGLNIVTDPIFGSSDKAPSGWEKMLSKGRASLRAAAFDRSIGNERGRDRREERMERRKEKLTAPLLPSAIREVRTRRGGGKAE